MFTVFLNLSDYGFIVAMRAPHACECEVEAHAPAVRDRPRCEVVALEGGTREADDRSLEAAVIVGRPVEGATEELTREAAHPDGADGTERP